MKIIKPIIGVILIIAIIAAFLALLGFVVAFLFNATMPYIFGLPEINIGQGIALPILIGLLFGTKFEIKKD